MGKYQSYKPSGIEWIGEIPFGWEIKKNKYFTTSEKRKSESGEEELLSVSEYKGVIPRKEIRDDDQVLTRSESLEGYLIVKKGNLVSNIMLMWKRGLGVSEYDGIVSPSYSVFSFNNSYPKYFHYLFRTEQYVSEFRRNSRGVIESRLRLYDDMFGSIYSHFPPLHEQEQIVKYLDEKTSIIDKLISTKERKIELLKEQRTSLINEVITKGLNPNVKMKDSGVEWIGEIPEHWGYIKLKHEYKIQKGRIPKKLYDVVEDGLVPYLSMDVLRGSEVSNYVGCDDGIFVEKEQIMILWDGSNSGEIIRVDNEGILSSTMGVLNKVGKKLQEDFSFYQLKSHEPEIRNNTNGMGIPHVDGQFVRSLVLLTPPLHEQEQIVEYLDKHTKEIDDLVGLEQRKIELLKEYRQSLISEVITGKIKVVE